MMTAPGFLRGAQIVTELARDTTFYEEANVSNSFTSAVRNIGPASATRRVYALIYGFVASTSTRTISTVTIGGVSAIILAQQNYFPNNPGAVIVCGIARADVPTGTTAAVAATFSGVLVNFACAVIALDRVNSGPAFDSATSTATSSAISTGAALDFSSGGYAMAIVGALAPDGSSPSCTWTNLTASADEIEDPPSGTTLAYSIAYQIGTPTSANNNITATYSNASGDKVLVAVSVR